LKRRKAGKGSKRFSWTITEDVALLSAASNSAQLIKITDAAGLLASLDSVKERIKYLKVNTECTSQFLNETCPGRGGSQKTPESLELQKSLVDLSRHRASKRTEHENATVDPYTNLDNAEPIGDGNVGGGTLGRAKRRALENIDVANSAFPLVLCDQNPHQEPLQVPYEGFAQLSLPAAASGEKQGLIPAAAVLNPHVGRLTIPDQWQLVIPPHRFALKEGTHVPQMSYAIGDVTRDTLVSAVALNIAHFLKIQPGDGIVHLVKVLVRSTGEHVYLDPATTAKDADLFNSSSRLLVTTLAPGSLGQQQAASMISAANTSPDHAPSHLVMVNNILGNTNSFSGEASQLSDIEKRTWTKLKKHTQKVNEIPLQMCYNCAMLNYSGVNNNLFLLSKMSQNRHFGNYFVTRSHLNESELGLAVVTRSEQL